MYIICFVVSPPRVDSPRLSFGGAGASRGEAGTIRQLAESGSVKQIIYFL